MKTILIFLAMIFISSAAQCENIIFRQNSNREDLSLEMARCLVSATNTATYNDCMRDKGWILVEKNRIDDAIGFCKEKSKTNGVSDGKVYFQCMKNENFDIETKTQRDGRAIGEEAKNLCSEIEYKEIYKKTTCSSSNLTLEQLTDNTKIDEIQKIQLFNLIKERALINSKLIENYKQGGKVDRRIGDYVSLVYYPAAEALRIDLYKGKLSWGDFNQNMKNLTLQFQAEQKKYNDELTLEIELRSKENKERYTKLIEGQRVTEQQKSQREIEAKQREANANAQSSRESQCRFRQAAEYMKPVPGGFFQSMQNANSVFDNCMAGVPQMNTTCSKDYTGQINCVTQ